MGVSKLVDSGLLNKQPVHSAANVWRAARPQASDIVGRLQVCLGHEPTVIGTPRMALEQWKYALRDVAAPGKGKVMIAAIRNRRWVEWAVYSACYMLDMGYEPYLLYSGQKIDSLYPETRKEHGFWHAARSIPQLQFIDLDTMPARGGDDAGYEEGFERGAHTVAAYNLRVEEYEAGDDPDAYRREVAKVKRMLCANAAACEAALHNHRAGCFVCPSGLIDESFAYREAARRAGVTGVFVEGWGMRPGHMIWSVDAPALDYDIEGWMGVLGEWDTDKESQAREYMAFREGRTVDDEGWLDNFHQVQRSTRTEPLPAAVEAFLERPGRFVLLGTNVIGDSATLGRATIFRSQHDWIRQVVAFVKEQPDLNLIVRAHPDEVVKRARQRLGEVASQASDGADNVLVLHGSDDVNTYALVDRIDVGLAWVSNIGLDMAIRGKPVIVAAAAQYASLGACHVPGSREEYFDLLIELAQNPVGPSQEAITRGKAYHHIVFKMMSLEADSRRYNAADYRIGDPGEHPDRKKFYQILVGELDKCGQPLKGQGKE